MPGDDPKMEGNGGYIKVFRKILDNDVFKDPHALHVWIYLLLAANWKDVMRLDGKVVKRGSLRFAVKAEAPRFGLTHKQLRRIIDQFAACSMVGTEGASRYTLITIDKYDTYQSSDYDEGQSKGNEGATRGQPEGNSLKNGKKERREEEKRDRHFHPPTSEEVHAYAKSIDFELDGDQFVAYYESVGWMVGEHKHMKDWKGAVRTWKIKHKTPPHRPRVATQEELDNWRP